MKRRDLPNFPTLVASFSGFVYADFTLGAKMKLAFDLLHPPGDQEMNLPPIILLHGMMDSRKTWKYIAPKLAKNTGRKVYALDARNHGDSPWDDVFNFNILSDDLYQFLNDHGIPKATIVGHSMGGRTAMTLALKQPEKIEKIVVEDIVPDNMSPKSSGLVVHMLNLLRESLSVIPPGSDEIRAKESIVTFMKSLLPPSQMSGKSIDLDMIPLKKDGDRYFWQANLDVIEDMLTTDKIRQELSGVYMGDALFLYGTKSFFKVETNKLIPKLFPRATKVKFEGAGHLIHHEFPKDFEREVTKFINGDIKPISKY